MPIAESQGRLFLSLFAAPASIWPFSYIFVSGWSTLDSYVGFWVVFFLSLLVQALEMRHSNYQCL